jgi:hypothetical protein
MTEQDIKEVRKIVRQEFIKLIPEFFAKSLVQLKQYFIKEIN